MDMDTIRDLALSLPLGFGFHPTDVELCQYYLRRKVLGHPIEHDIIPELDIYKYEPWDLFAMPPPPLLSFLNSHCNTNSTLHFFTPRRQYPNLAYRFTGAGYWKSTSQDCIIKVDNANLCTKKTFVFRLSTGPGIATEWVMHEYSLHEDQCKDAPHLKDLYVLCQVTKRDADYYEELPVLDQLEADQVLNPPVTHLILSRPRNPQRAQQLSSLLN